jgi:hypothetical protein
MKQSVDRAAHGAELQRLVSDTACRYRSGEGGPLHVFANISKLHGCYSNRMARVIHRRPTGPPFRRRGDPVPGFSDLSLMKQICTV